MQTQGIITKNSSRPKKPKTKDLKSVPQRDNIVTLAKKKDKQKRFKCQQKRIREPKVTPATDNNTVKATKKKNKRDIAKVIYFNCNKKGHYASNCTKPKN